MRFPDESRNRPVELGTRQFELSPDEAERLPSTLSPPGNPTRRRHA